MARLPPVPCEEDCTRFDRVEERSKSIDAYYETHKRLDRSLRRFLALPGILFSGGSRGVLEDTLVRRAESCNG